MMGAMAVTADNLAAAIDELRLRGRVVGVHSSLRSFGGLDGGADGFIDAFLGAAFRDGISGALTANGTYTASAPNNPVTLQGSLLAVESGGALKVVGSDGSSM